MEWVDFWTGIQYLFEEILFVPLDLLRKLELDSWFLANIFNWIFILIVAFLFIYWMKQLKGFQEEEERNAAHSAHSS